MWEKDTGFLDLVLRYAWDPVAADLVPLPEPPRYESSNDLDAFDPDEPLTLSWGDDQVYYTVPFEVVDYRTSRMELEAASPLGDPATWTWVLRR